MPTELIWLVVGLILIRPRTVEGFGAETPPPVVDLESIKDLNNFARDLYQNRTVTDLHVTGKLTVDGESRLKSKLTADREVSIGGVELKGDEEFLRTPPLIVNNADTDQTAVLPAVIAQNYVSTFAGRAKTTSDPEANGLITGINSVLQHSKVPPNSRYHNINRFDRSHHQIWHGYKISDGRSHAWFHHNYGTPYGDWRTRDTVPTYTLS